MLAITSFYVGLLTLLFLALSVRVINMRKAQRISVGDGGNSDLENRIRAQANFAEYVPLGLILCALAELQQAPAIALHAIGLSLLFGRVFHAISMTKTIFPMRVAGMLLTFGGLGISAVALILHSVI